MVSRELAGEQHKRIAQQNGYHARHAHAVAAVHPAVLEDDEEPREDGRAQLLEHAEKQHPQRAERPGKKEIHIRHFEHAHARRKAGVHDEYEHQRVEAQDDGVKLARGAKLLHLRRALAAAYDDKHKQRDENDGIDELRRGAEHALYLVLESRE